MRLKFSRLSNDGFVPEAEVNLRIMNGSKRESRPSELKPERHLTNSRRHEANHSFPRLDYCFPALELSRIVAAGRLLHGDGVSARLNTKLAGLFRFSGVFSISVPDNRRELLIIGSGYLEI